MKLDFYVDTKHNIIMQSFYGEISIASITSTLPQIWEHPDYSPMLDSVVDLRNSTVLFSTEELSNLVKEIEKEERALQGKLAIMVSEPVSAALATIFAEKRMNNQPIGIFCSEYEVERFLSKTEVIFEKADHIEIYTVNF